jgi:hypothetical protein
MSTENEPLFNSSGVAPTVREIEGRLVIDWPRERPVWFAITSEVFEALVARANGDSS